MRNLLRACYKEVGIRGVNATIFQKRLASLIAIREVAELEKQEYDILTEWILGEDNRETEKCLVHIEELFCQDDEAFTKENKVELQLLCEILLYDFCKLNSVKKYPLMILCGANLGKKLSSNILYQKFKDLIKKERLFLRTNKELIRKYPVSINSKLQESIKNTKAKLDEQTSFNYLTEHFDLLVKEINILGQQNKYLYQQNIQLQQLISCQREETDILWWMINEWSELYEKSFNKLSKEELAIAAPVELYIHLQYNLFPYAGDRILYKLLNQYTNSEKKINIYKYLEKIYEKLFETLFKEKINIEKVQWIFGILDCMKQCGCEGDAWKRMFKKKYGEEIDNICLTPYEFASQFQIELELRNYLL